MRLTPFLSVVNRTFMAHWVSFDTKIVRFCRNADFSRGIFLILHRFAFGKVGMRLFEPRGPQPPPAEARCRVLRSLLPEREKFIS